MHFTVGRTFELFQKIYLSPDTNISVLEIGSQNFNGGLRDLKMPNLEWLGIDMEAGPGVDTVVQIGSSFPFENATFDLVLCSSVFEHDIRFWNTFLEMARVTKPQGVLLLIMPSQGLFHLYPLDAFRFYPDAGIALEKWADSQGLATKLVESFTTKPEKDVFADFVAIFSESPSNFTDKMIGGELMGENWIIQGELQTDTFQEFPYELRRIKELEERIASMRLKLQEFVQEL